MSGSAFITNPLHDRLNGVFLEGGKGIKGGKSSSDDFIGSFISECQAFQHKKVVAWRGMSSCHGGRHTVAVVTAGGTGTAVAGAAAAAVVVGGVGAIAAVAGTGVGAVTGAGAGGTAAVSGFTGSAGCGGLAGSIDSDFLW